MQHQGDAAGRAYVPVVMTCTQGAGGKFEFGRAQSDIGDIRATLRGHRARQLPAAFAIRAINLYH